MSSDPLLIIDPVFLGVSVLICALAAYRALKVRRALVSFVYRRRALWTGIVAFIVIYYGLFGIAGEFGVWGLALGPANLGLYLAFFILSVIGSITIFSWIDSAIGVALELDFFHRDALRWRRLRRFTWAAILLGAFGSGASTSELGYEVFATILVIPVIYSALALVVSGRRVRDETMKRYIKWMGLLVAAVAVEIVTASINFSLNFPLVAFAYFLYRAAGSLSSTNRLEEMVETSPGDVALPPL